MRCEQASEMETEIIINSITVYDAEACDEKEIRSSTVKRSRDSTRICIKAILTSPPFPFSPFRLLVLRPITRPSYLNLLKNTRVMTACLFEKKYGRAIIEMSRA
jgi:hypothetical protein